MTFDLNGVCGIFLSGERERERGKMLASSTTVIDMYLWQVRGNYGAGMSMIYYHIKV